MLVREPTGRRCHGIHMAVHGRLAYPLILVWDRIQKGLRFAQID
jgi:hypothetical protein